MLKFQVIEDGQVPAQWVLRNAHLLGSDRSAIRAEVAFENGLILCQKRELGAAALAVQRAVGDCGELTLPTCLLPERAEPYALTLEQARHRLMVVYNKLEDWGMFDFLGEEHPVSRRVERTRRLFIEALSTMATDPAGAEAKAQECLISGIDASEELALAHADLLLTRRKNVGLIPKQAIGAGVALDQNNDRVRATLLANFDFVRLPTPWKALAPAEGEYKWALMDAWADWAIKSHMPLVAGPVISFDSFSLPDWIYMWEHDYDAVREEVYQHVERMVNRYRSAVSVWTVVSGLHLGSGFSFSFDQIMELTRMCVMQVKRLQPSAKVLIEVRQPWGEYFAANPRSIPPFTYADLLAQAGVNFDGYSLRLLMGQSVSGQYTRDLMQVSAILDQFTAYGKPLHVTVGVPSEPVTEMMIASSDPAKPVDPNCGYWRKPWSPLVQSRWLEAMFYIGLSKPFVESVAWQDLVDHANPELPMAGLIGEDLQPKVAFRRLVAFRRSLTAKSPPGAPGLPGSASPLGPGPIMTSGGPGPTA